MIDLNATQAAIRAGYSAKTANRIGAQNLLKLDIQAEIERLKASSDLLRKPEIQAEIERQARPAIVGKCWYSSRNHRANNGMEKNGLGYSFPSRNAGVKSDPVGQQAHHPD